MNWKIWMSSSVCLIQAAIAFACTKEFYEQWPLFIFCTFMFGLAFMQLIETIIKAARETP